MARYFLLGAGVVLLFVLVPLALLGAWAIFNTFGSRDFIFHDRVVSESLAPDGRHLARVVLTTGPTVWTTRLLMVRKGDGGGEQRLLQYRDMEVRVSADWTDTDTLQVMLPCEPPEYLIPTYDESLKEGWRRIVVNYVFPKNCRFRRGVM